MNVPAELKYSKDHEWIRIEGHSATVGITEFAQSELGDIVYLDVTSKGKDLKPGDVFGSVEAVKTVSDLFMPVEGSITEVNSVLESKPELINSDPYGEGWMVKIKVTDLKGVEALLGADEYKDQIGVS